MGRIEVRWEAVRMRIVPASMLARQAQPDLDDADDWRFLRRPALLGFLALVAVAVGASLPSSPFKLDMTGTWFFGEPAPGAKASQSFMLFGLVAVYGGLILLARVWYGLWRALTRRPGVPTKYLAWILMLWMIPMLLVPPIFSRDVFSYAAQGEMMSRHLNPYLNGPNQLGFNAYTNPVDPLWGNTPAPYGPLFLMVDGFFASVSMHNALATVVLLRLLAVAGVGLIAYCIPKLARVYGLDPGPVFVFAVLNPVVLLMLVGGAHNDAIMVGLLLAGITAAKLKHPVWGVVLCTLAAAIKVPAALGIVYVAWDWVAPSMPLRHRIRPLVTAGLLSFGIMVLLSKVSGLGMGWIANLGTPGTVRSWLAPATGVGMAATWTFHLVGIGVSQAGVLSVTRVAGLAAAAGAGVYLLPRERPLHRQPQSPGPHPAPLRHPRPGRAALVPDLGTGAVGRGGDQRPAAQHPGGDRGDGAVHRPPRRAPAPQRPHPGHLQRVRGGGGAHRPAGRARDPVGPLVLRVA